MTKKLFTVSTDGVGRRRRRLNTLSQLSIVFVRLLFLAILCIDGVEVNIRYTGRQHARQFVQRLDQIRCRFGELNSERVGVLL